MPKIISKQKQTFETNELFRRLARDGEIKYMGHKDRPMQERQRRCAEGCRQGKADVAFLSCGINLPLRFFPPEYYSPIPPPQYCDFEREPGKVHFISPMLFNGVAVNVRGYINLLKLDGSARMEYDPDRAAIELSREPHPADPPETEEQKNNNGSGENGEGQNGQAVN